MDVEFFAASEQMNAVVKELAHLARFVVLDLGVGLHPSTQRALAHCTKFIVVIEPDPNLLPHAKNLLDDLTIIGIPTNKIIGVMVHRVRSEMAMNAPEIQRTLGIDVHAVFTPVPDLAFQAAQSHQSMLTLDPNSFTAQQVLKLVDQITAPVEA